MDPHASWSAYAPNGLEIYEIEGNHENILLEPQVQFVAQRLRVCLDEARLVDHALSS
jgi:thioesterase domain-containing protein